VAGDNPLASRPDPSGPFDEVEFEILRRYFGLKPRLDEKLLLEPDPPGDVSEDPNTEKDEEHRRSARDSGTGVRVSRAHLHADDFPGDIFTANAVARICLKSIQGHLPNFVAFNRTVVIEGRRRERHPSRPVMLLSAHLFTINWATSGPGFEWPEAYRLTFIPSFSGTS
jgi:hypothetical protein